MKRLFFMKVMALVAAMVCCTGTLRAQEITVLDGYPPLKNNIVRQYLFNMDIHYCEDGTNHYFILYDLANPNMVIKASFPAYLYIRDFEVFEDMVYFCGVFPNGGNQMGFVGQISVSDLFYDNGPYNIGILNYTMLGVNHNIPYEAHMASCDRMDIFRDKGGRGVVHLAVVGEIEHGYTYNPPLRKTVGDFWCDGVDWKGMALYQKSDNHIAFDEEADDVISLVDTHIVNGDNEVIGFQVQAFFAFLPNPTVK